MLITFSHWKSMASDYGSSDSPQPSFMHVFNKVFVLSHDNLMFYRFYFVPCAPPMPPSSPSPLVAYLNPPPLLARGLGGAFCVKA